MMAKTAKLILDDKTFELPVIEGSEGELGVDVTKLRNETGYITFDPGFANSGSCTSEITYIDGEEGILRYHGIPIEAFNTDEPDFIEVAWLLIFGKLPNHKERTGFSEKLSRYAHINEDMKHHFQGFPNNAHPMAMLSSMINALSCFYPELMHCDDDEAFDAASARLISKIRTIAAYTYRSSMGLPNIYPDPALGYCKNFLHMMFSMPYDTHEISDEVGHALNLLLILHADHEQNCSTSTVRMVGSSGANLFASISAGVCALWGHLHGGANLAVIEMLAEMHKGNLSAEKAIEMAKDKSNPFKLMGFGHRVYKNYDPRAKVLKESCDKVLAQLNVSDPLLDIARSLEEKALSDSYFKDRNLFPNVDFYSGIILKAIGIPTNMFTVMFAMGRLPGWIAQWKEQRDNPNGRISRPRQIYTGPNKTEYIPIDQR